MQHIIEEELVEELNQKNIRPTAIRLRVLAFLREQSVAFGLSDIEDALSPIDRTTLFRTLKTFEKQGLIHGVHTRNGQLQYAPCADSCQCSYDDHLHAHFACQACHKTFCLYEVRFTDVRLPEGFKPVDANVVIKGICARCSG